MEINSSLYECTVMHHRLQPLKNRFVYKIFMFSFDLDELEILNDELRLFSHNSWNIFSFRDSDHMQNGKPAIKENILEYLHHNDIELHGGKIYLITNVRTFGYVFNPVSFYFCFNSGGHAVCAIPEVGNTFGEMKPYLLKKDDETENGFRKRVTKYFYVSPFIELDTEFDFNLLIPNEKLHITIDDYKDGNKIFLTSLIGKKKPLTDVQLLWYSVRFPLITLQVILLIHWQALKLYLKKLPYFKKTENPHLQKEIAVWNK
jgi:uncharacterized protein